MTTRKYSSRSQQTTLVSLLTDSANNATVVSASALLGGATVSAGEIFTVVINPHTALEEIVDVTSVSTNNLLITRGRDGSTAKEHSAGAVIRHMVIGRDLRESNLHIEATGAYNDGTATHTLHGIATGEGDIVATTKTQTLANKTLTAPKFADGGFLADTNGNEMVILDTVTSAVNEITVANAATAGKPTISATGGDTNITLNLVSKGTGTVQANAVDVVTLSGTQSLTNKTISGSALTLSTTTSSVDGRIAWDSTNDQLKIGDNTTIRTFSPDDKAATLTSKTITSGTLGSALAAGTFKITGLGDPTLAQDAATKNYVDTGASSQVAAAAASATAAAGSATTASNAATTATTQASNASTSASNASTSASNASTSATNAASSATSATTSANTAVAASALLNQSAFR
jgi:hypothetical protein